MFFFSPTSSPHNPFFAFPFPVQPPPPLQPTVTETPPPSPTTFPLLLLPRDIPFLSLYPEQPHATLPSPPALPPLSPPPLNLHISPLPRPSNPNPIQPSELYICPIAACPLKYFRPDPVCGADRVTYWCGSANYWGCSIWIRGRGSGGAFLFGVRGMVGEVCYRRLEGRLLFWKRGVGGGGEVGEDEYEFSFGFI